MDHWDQHSVSAPTHGYERGWELIRESARTDVTLVLDNWVTGPNIRAELTGFKADTARVKNWVNPV